MKIIGFNITKMSAAREKITDTKIKVNSNIQVKDITKTQVDLIKDKDTANIKFEFKIDYEPKCASILIEGTIAMILEKEEFKDLMKQWKKKKISEKIRLPLFNTILGRCSLKALQLEDELNLPLHVQLPQIRPDQSNTSYTG